MTSYIPQTSKGVLVVLGVLILAFSYFLFQMLITWIVFGAILAAVLFLVYVVGVRLYRWLIGV